MSARLSSFLDAPINRDPEDPSAKTRPPIKAVEVAVDQRENLLNRVCRIFGRKENALRDREDLVVIAAVNDVEGPLIARKEAGDDDCVLIQRDSSWRFESV